MSIISWTVRDAAAADLDRILAITNAAIVGTTTTFNLTPTTLEARHAWLRERREQGFPVLVAESDGDVGGFGTFGTFRPWEGYLHTVEHSLYVDAALHGRGCGSALLAGLIERTRAHGLHVMVGGIGAENARSIGLHRRFGFVETGRLLEVGRKFDRWLDLVFMQKLL